MRCVRYIETFAWVLLVGILGVWSLSVLARSIHLFAQSDLWYKLNDSSLWSEVQLEQLFKPPHMYGPEFWERSSSYWRLGFLFPAASATILGCHAQRPLGVCRPHWMRTLLAVWALVCFRLPPSPSDLSFWTVVQQSARVVRTTFFWPLRVSLEHASPGVLELCPQRHSVSRWTAQPTAPS